MRGSAALTVALPRSTLSLAPLFDRTENPTGVRGVGIESLTCGSATTKAVSRSRRGEVLEHVLGAVAKATGRDTLTDRGHGR